MTHGVMVALRFLVSSVKVRVLVGQQKGSNESLDLFFYGIKKDEMFPEEGMSLKFKVKSQKTLGKCKVSPSASPCLRPSKASLQPLD